MKPAALAALLAPLALAAGLPGCVAPVGPVEVTRFHVPDAGVLGHGTIAVEPGPGMAGDSLEFRSYAAAVAHQLGLVGYREAAGGEPAGQVAHVRIERRSHRPDRAGGPVSVGVGGGTGGFGAGVGLGIGIDLSGPPPEQVDTMLSVTIRDRRTARVLWEGRSSFTVAAKSPLAGTQLGAAKMAEALFGGFPGNSGETIQVR
jgi:hypothetical protein